jgi:chromosome partitioning protein
MRPQSVIISVINNKGGVGKTTTTCNLADALARKGKSVLVVDMDSQCNATSMLLGGENPNRDTLYELLDPKNTETSVQQCIYPTAHENLQIIPNINVSATLEPSLIDIRPKCYYILRDHLRDFALEKYDITIIDNPPNMGTFVICSLYASDFVIVPNDSGSKYSIEGLIRAVEFIKGISNKANPDLKFLRLLITHLDKRTSISRAIIHQVHQIFHSDEVFETTIPVNTAFQQAELQDQTIFKYAPKASGASAYRNLAVEVISILGNNSMK